MSEEADGFERRCDTAKRGKCAEWRDAFATVVPESQTGRVGRDSPGHVRHRADRAGQCRRSASLPRRAARHDECARVHHLRGCDRRVRQRQRGQPLALSGSLRGSLCDCSSRREDDRQVPRANAWHSFTRLKSTTLRGGEALRISGSVTHPANQQDRLVVELSAVSARVCEQPVGDGRQRLTIARSQHALRPVEAELVAGRD